MAIKKTKEKKVINEKIIPNLSFSQLEQYCNFFSKSNLRELIIDESGYKLVLKKRKAHMRFSRDFAEAPMPMPMAVTLADEKTDKPQVAETKVAEESVENNPDKTIFAPVMGTFYTASSPTANPFVSVGDNVKKGMKVCIIEAMKIMNEIDSPISGKIIRICVEDGKPVNAGDPLFILA